jgi:hypothetical protein
VYDVKQLRVEWRQSQDALQEKEEEERELINDLTRHAQLAVAWRRRWFGSVILFSAS